MGDFLNWGLLRVGCLDEVGEGEVGKCLTWRPTDLIVVISLIEWARSGFCGE